MKQLEDVSFEDLYQRLSDRAQELEPSEGLKQCTGCGKTKPRTAQYFYRHGTSGGFNQPCKLCQCEQKKAWRREAREAQGVIAKLTQERDELRAENERLRALVNAMHGAEAFGTITADGSADKQFKEYGLLPWPWKHQGEEER